MAKKILFVIEGERAETNMLISTFERSLNLCNQDFEIFKYKTNIHVLFREMNKMGFDSFLSYLYMINKEIFPDDMFSPETAFSSVYLFFDLDPQAELFSIVETNDIVTYFNDETVNGKVYISYPMVESVFDFISYNFKDYCNREYPIDKLSASYKSDARRNSFLGQKYRNCSFRKIKNEDIYSICLLNMKKYCYLTNSPFTDEWKEQYSPLKAFISEIPFIKRGVVSILNCGMLLIPDYSNIMFNELKKLK